MIFQITVYDLGNEAKQFFATGADIITKLHNNIHTLTVVSDAGDPVCCITTSKFVVKMYKQDDYGHLTYAELDDLQSVDNKQAKLSVTATNKQTGVATEIQMTQEKLNSIQKGTGWCVDTDTTGYKLYSAKTHTFVLNVGSVGKLPAANAPELRVIATYKHKLELSPVEFKCAKWVMAAINNGSQYHLIVDGVQYDFNNDDWWFQTSTISIVNYT